MPVVPRYGDRKVAPEALPAPRLTPSATEETFGGGPTLEAVSTEARGVNQNIQKILIENKRQADEVAVQDADLQAGILETKLQIDSAKMLGKNAAGVPEFINEEWRNGTQEIKKSLSNDRQKAAAQRKFSARYLNLYKTASVHMANEFQKHDTEELKNYNENAVNEAVLNYGDFDRFKLSLLQQKSSIEAYADRNGKDKNWIQSEFQDAQNKTAKSVIAKMIEDSPDMAIQRLPDFKGILSADESVELKAKAERIKDQVKRNEEDERKNQEQLNTLNTATEFLNGKLSLSVLQKKILDGQIKPQDAAIFETALYNQKGFFSDKKRRANKGTAIINMIAGLDDTDNIGSLVLNATKAYNEKTIDADDLAWIIKTANDKLKNPNDAKWDWLRRSVNSLIGGGGEVLNLIKDISKNPSKMKYEVGQVISHRGHSAKIVGFDSDGDPLIEPIGKK